MVMHPNFIAHWRRVAKVVGAVAALTIFFAAVSPTTVLAQESSNPPGAAMSDVIDMFGLEWGLSSDQVHDLDYFTLQIMEMEENGQPYNASAYPPILHDIRQVILYFGFDDRLWRIAIMGLGQRDQTGSAKALIARYDEIRGQLAEVYGPGESFHYNTTERKNQDFVLGALQMGQAWHFSEFTAADTHVQLGLRASSVVAGRYALYLKNTVLEEKVLADMQASQRLGAGAEEMITEGGGSEIPNRE